jgi:hypothetical protein
MKKDRAAQKILFSGTFVVPADLSQQAKSAAADSLTYSDN